MNENDTNCLENKLIRSLTEANAQDDLDKFDNQIEKCLLVFSPYIIQRSLNLHDSYEPAAVVKVQAKTSNGVLSFVSHDSALVAHERKPAIQNLYPQLQAFAASCITKREEVDYEIFKVHLEGLQGPYCLKTVHRCPTEEQFSREIDCLSRVKHTNIVALEGLLKAENSDNIEGILLEFISGKKLSKITNASESKKEAWKSQLESALHHAHKHCVIWGDAKPGNVIINENDNLVIFDFGAGWTKGWVDAELNETVLGDWQGVRRICSFIDNIGLESC